MLGKLVKYDLKYGAKLFFLLQGVQLIAALIGRYFFLERVDFHAPPAELASSLYLFLLFFSLIFGAVSLGITLLIAVRFYTNLFTDEGYLSWTIPVSPMQHFWAKFLSGSILYALGVTGSFLAFWILYTGKNTYAAYLEIAPDLTEILGMTLEKFALLLFGHSLLCTFSAVLMIYVCVTIGQLFPAHRVLGAVITYFALYFTLTASVTGCMLLTGLFPGIKYTMDTANTVSIYLSSTLKMTFGIYLVAGILEYLLIRWILTKKLNLM